MDNNELMHYGRKGMKWGQHIFGKVDKASGNKKVTYGKPVPMSAKVGDTIVGKDGKKVKYGKPVQVEVPKSEESKVVGKTSDGIRILEKSKRFTKDFLSKERDEPTKEDVVNEQKRYEKIAKEYGLSPSKKSEEEARNTLYESRSSDLVFAAAYYAEHARNTGDHSYIKDAETLYNRSVESAKKITDTRQYNDYIYGDSWLEGYWAYEMYMEDMGRRVKSLTHSDITSVEDELMHYGRKGMKWYQNIFTKKKSSGKKSDQDDDDNQEQKPKPKSIKEMSDYELRTAISRKQLEDEYLRTFSQPVSRGQKFLKAIEEEVLIPSAKKAGEAVADQLFAKGLEAIGLEPPSKKKKKVQKKDD